MPCIKQDDDAPVINDDDNSSSEESVVKYIRDYFPTRLRWKIVNAQSGHVYDYIQGSYDELRLYKIIDTRSFYDEHGCSITKADPVNKTPNFLYYDTPEQCMRHLEIKMNPIRVKAWHDKQAKLFSITGEFNKDAWDKIKKESYAHSNRAITS